MLDDFSSIFDQREMPFSYEQKGPVFVALQKAIVARFEDGDWRELGYKTGHESYINGHSRLLRSLKWGDDDYSGAVFQVLEYFYSCNNGKPFHELFSHPKIKSELEDTNPALLSELGLIDQHVKPVEPRALSVSEVVEKALQDADQLLHASGPLSAIDRLHTALHGYIKHLCVGSGLDVAPDAPLTSLFKTLRTSHPSFKTTTSTEIERVLQGFGTSLDAINTIRNRQSIAHPNEDLLGENEAHLVVNAVRTIFHYLQAKVRS